jgi:farnesyl-diphosphate farnesyltransferase
MATAADHSAERPRREFAADDVLQGYLLQGVSRTFALTIPQLPARLTTVVGNAYLLCRIVDTIEDEAGLSAADKRFFCEWFAKVVAGEASAERFAERLHPLLSEDTPPAERGLIAVTPRVIAVTRRFNAVQRRALAEGVAVMAGGMAEFQERGGARGLPRLEEMDRYCYYVAGVVGEMLTELFCDYSPEVAARREALMKLAPSFGQGLQMTNILKDLWEDRRRGACWLPRDVFSRAGFDLDELEPGRYREAFGKGLSELIAVAHGHLDNAMSYTVLIPPRETGIRNFCLWAIGMALLTLRKINRRKDFIAGNEVKISRRSVRATILAARASVGSDRMLRSLFRLAGRGVPRVPLQGH